MRRYSRLLTGLVLVFSVSCASAAKRYEQGQELEQQGRSAEAAQRYIDALKKDATLADARLRLAETGNRAIGDGLRAMDAFEMTAAHIDAAESLRAIDALVRDAAGVGVSLQTPAGYADKRGVILSRAVDQAISQARASAQRGNFSDAAQVIDRAQQRWEPRADQQTSLARALYDTHMAWGQGELLSSRFRSAYTHAETAAAIPGFDRGESGALRDEAVRRGTMMVAVFPAVARGGVDNRLLPEINDLLALDYWQHPPQWIDVANTIEAQRVVRIRNLSGRDLEPADVGSLARQLNARYGVALTLDSVRHTESKVTKQRKTVKTRAGKDTAYTVEEGQVETWARVSWREVDAIAGRGVTDRGDASDRASTSFRRATYVGNWRDLELGANDRALFERDARDNQDVLRQVARALVEKIGPDIFRALLRHVE